MLSDCVFLEREEESGTAPALVCSAGVNFREVGADRALCRVCLFGQRHEVFQCSHLDADAIWRRGQIEMKLVCLLPGDTLASARCAGCPARQTWPQEPITDTA